MKPESKFKTKSKNKTASNFRLYISNLLSGFPDNFFVRVIAAVELKLSFRSLTMVTGSRINSMVIGLLINDSIVKWFTCKYLKNSITRLSRKRVISGNWVLKDAIG